MIQVLAVAICAVILWIARAAMYRRYRQDRLTARQAGGAMGLVWALFPAIFEAASGHPFDWTVVAIASSALFISVCLTTIWFLEHLLPREKARSARSDRPV